MKEKRDVNVMRLNKTLWNVKITITRICNFMLPLLSLKLIPTLYLYIIVSLLRLCEIFVCFIIIIIIISLTLSLYQLLLNDTAKSTFK